MLVIEEELLLDSNKDLILTHLYIKSKQNAKRLEEKDFKLTEAVREMLYYLYEMGGISSKEDFNNFVSICTKNTGIKGKSVANTMSKCVGLDIVKNIGKYKKVISEEWLPSKGEDFIGLDYRITTKEAVGAV